MKSWGKRSVGLLGVLFVFGFVAVTVAPAAEPKSKKSEGRLVTYDAAAETVTVKVKGKDEVFHVKPEGTVLTRTSVTLNGRPAKLSELPAKAPVIVYWRENDGNKERKDARKIDAPRVPEDLLEEFE